MELQATPTNMPFPLEHYEIGEVGSKQVIDDLLFHVFTFLTQNPADLGRASFVCRRWNRIAKDRFLWRVIWHNMFPLLKVPEDPYRTIINKLASVSLNLSQRNLFESTIHLSNNKKIGSLSQKRKKASTIYCTAEDSSVPTVVSHSIASIDMMSKTVLKEFHTPKTKVIIYTAVMDSRLIGIHADGAVSVWDQLTGALLNLDPKIGAPFASHRFITHQEQRFFVLTNDAVKIIDGTTFEISQVVDATEIPHLKSCSKLEVYGNFGFFSLPSMHDKSLPLFYLYDFENKQCLYQPYDVHQFCLVEQDNQAFFVGFWSHFGDLYYNIHILDKKLGIANSYTQVHLGPDLIPNESGIINSFNSTLKFHVQFWDKNTLVIAHSQKVIFVDISTGVQCHFSIRENLAPVQEVVISHNRLFMIHTINANYHKELSISVYKKGDEDGLYLVKEANFKGFASQVSFIPVIRCGTIMGIDQMDPRKLRALDLKETSQESPQKKQKLLPPARPLMKQPRRLF